MIEFSKQDRQRAVAQTLGSWAIEGFKPDAEYLALLDRYIGGELTIAQVSAATDAKFGVRKNSAARSVTDITKP